MDEDFLDFMYDEELDIKEAIKGIDPNVLQRFDELHSIKINNDFNVISNSMFKNCKLNSIEFKNIIIDIDDMAFYGCKNLTEIKFVDGLECIGRKAFYKCWELKNITFPKSLKRIEKYAFVLSGIKNVSIPKTVEYVDENAFEPEVKIVYYNV